MNEEVFSMFVAISKRYEQLSKMSGSQAKLASQLEVYAPTLNRQIKSKLTLDMIFRTCIAFPNLSLEWLLRGVGNSNINLREGNNQTSIVQSARKVVAQGSVNNVNNNTELITELRKQIEDKNNEILFLRSLVSNR